MAEGKHITKCSTYTESWKSLVPQLFDFGLAVMEDNESDYGVSVQELRDADLDDGIVCFLLQ